MTTQIQPIEASPFAHIKAPNWSTDGMTAAKQVAKTFADFHLGDEIRKALDEVGYVNPTPVQSSCLPLVLAGLDLIVQSQTGTGKTAAFAIPTLEMLEPGTRQVEALILAPTRELAKQIQAEFDRLGTHKKVPVACVYGGTGFQQQYDDLENAQVVCATPGRLLDLLKRKALSLEHLKLFILDEADEMLNMGFEKELDAIVEFLPETRQSLLYSATVGEDIKRISSHILTYPEFVSISGDNIAAKEVEHIYYMVTGLGRLWDLNRVIEVEQPESAIVFCNTRDDSFLVANFLRKQGYVADVLNGDLPQKDREKTLARLRKGELRFLVATDVAARGIDISDLSHVLNFSLPESPETYVHRTGRTGRAGKKGVALSLISPREIGTFYFLRRIYKMELTERQLPTAEQVQAIKVQRAVEQVVDRLEKDQTPADNGMLAMVDQLLESEKARLFVARLLAFYQSGPAPSALNGAIDEAALRQRPNGAVAPPVVEAPEEVAAIEEVEAAPEEVEEAIEAIEEAAEAGAAAAQEEVEEAIEAAEEAAEVVEEAAQEAQAQAAEEEDDDAPRGRRRRRRRRRRSRDPQEEAEELSQEDDLDHLEIDLVGLDEDDDEDEVEVPEEQEEGDPEEALRRLAAPKEQVRLHINVGSNKLETESSLLELLYELAGMDPEDFGEVTLRRRFCYVEVREDMVDDVIEAVKGHQYEGVTLKAALARNP